MSQTTYLWTPPPVHSVAVRGQQSRLPVNRIFCVGRNYHAHAIEMGRPVEKATGKPFYFTKAASALAESGATVPYPPGTKNFHYEMELVVAIGSAGFRVTEADAHKLIYGYACGLDMTRRDLQLEAREQGRPWDLGKDVENSAVIAEIVPAAGQVLGAGEISLSVNGTVKQSANLNQLIWSIPELIADLSSFYHLEPGDLIYTGTPEGVGPVLAGDRIEGRIEGVGEISLLIGPAE